MDLNDTRDDADDSNLADNQIDHPAPTISTEVRLPLESEERSRVEYLLQMSLQGQARKARILDIVAISNPHLSLRFQKRTHNLVTLECWVDVNKLSSRNPLSHVIEHGFNMDAKGLVFTCGAISLNSSAHGVSSENGSRNISTNEGKNTQKNIHQFMLCQVGVGRSKCVEASKLQENTERNENFAITSGYDSLYIHKGKLYNEKGSVGECRPDQLPKHRYLVQSEDLVLPSYVLSIELDPIGGGSRTESQAELCDSCDKSSALVYCFADKASLCDRCDRTIHSANKLVGKHTRVPIEDRPVTDFGRCVYHPLNKVDFYCHLCQVPVCVHCKMVGSHSAGDASTHKLTEIREAYDLALMASKKSDPFLAERKIQLENDLSNLNSKLITINANAADIEAELRSRIESTIKSMQECRDEKVDIIMSEQVDLRRQLIRVKWLENFLEFQQRKLGPVDFLEAWGRHVKYRTELHTPDAHSGVHRSRYVDADIVVKGELVTTSRSSLDFKRLATHSSKPPSSDDAISVEAQSDVDDNDTLCGENHVRSLILRDLDAANVCGVQGTKGRSSPSSVASSVYSMPRSSIGGGIASPGGLSLKDFVTSFEPKVPSSLHRTNSVERHGLMYTTSDNLVADRLHTPSRARMSAALLQRQPSPTGSEDSATTHHSHVSTSKAWTDSWGGGKFIASHHKSTSLKHKYHTSTQPIIMG